MSEIIKTIVKCKKDLVNDGGQQDFTKGRTYEGRICNVLSNLKVIDDGGSEHILGNWAKHFKNITPGFVKNK